VDIQPHARRHVLVQIVCRGALHDGNLCARIACVRTSVLS
jgi:hypothetical protein